MKLKFIKSVPIFLTCLSQQVYSSMQDIQLTSPVKKASREILIKNNCEINDDNINKIGKYLYNRDVQEGGKFLTKIKIKTDLKKFEEEQSKNFNDERQRQHEADKAQLLARLRAEDRAERDRLAQQRQESHTTQQRELEAQRQDFQWETVRMLQENEQQRYNMAHEHAAELERLKVQNADVLLKREEGFKAKKQQFHDETERLQHDQQDLGRLYMEQLRVEREAMLAAMVHEHENQKRQFQEETKGVQEQLAKEHTSQLEQLKFQQAEDWQQAKLFYENEYSYHKGELANKLEKQRKEFEKNLELKKTRHQQKHDMNLEIHSNQKKAEYKNEIEAYYIINKENIDTELKQWKQGELYKINRDLQAYKISQQQLANRDFLAGYNKSKSQLDHHYQVALEVALDGVDKRIDQHEQNLRIKHENKITNYNRVKEKQMQLKLKQTKDKIAHLKKDQEYSLNYKALMFLVTAPYELGLRWVLEPIFMDYRPVQKLAFPSEPIKNKFRTTRKIAQFLTMKNQEIGLEACLYPIFFGRPVIYNHVFGFTQWSVTPLRLKDKLDGL